MPGPGLRCAPVLIAVRVALRLVGVLHTWQQAVQAYLEEQALKTRRGGQNETPEDVCLRPTPDVPPKVTSTILKLPAAEVVHVCPALQTQTTARRQRRRP